MMIKGVVRLREYVACSNLINHKFTLLCPASQRGIIPMTEL